MQLKNITLVLCLLVAVGAFAEPAHAQFSSLQQMLFRGATYTGERKFVSNPQGGPLFDNNLFSQRLEFNRTGQGYTYEQFRFFGTDSFNNPPRSQPVN